jgi:hypothetical protein
MSANHNPHGSILYDSRAWDEGAVVQDKIKQWNRSRHLSDELLRFILAGHKLHTHAFTER